MWFAYFLVPNTQCLRMVPLLFSFNSDFLFTMVTLSVHVFNVITWYNHTHALIQCLVWFETKQQRDPSIFCFTLLCFGQVRNCSDAMSIHINWMGFLFPWKPDTKFKISKVENFKVLHFLTVTLQIWRSLGNDGRFCITDFCKSPISAISGSDFWFWFLVFFPGSDFLFWFLRFWFPVSFFKSKFRFRVRAFFCVWVFCFHERQSPN